MPRPSPFPPPICNYNLSGRLRSIQDQLSTSDFLLSPGKSIDSLLNLLTINPHIHLIRVEAQHALDQRAFQKRKFVAPDDIFIPLTIDYSMVVRCLALIGATGIRWRFGEIFPLYLRRVSVLIRVQGGKLRHTAVLGKYHRAGRFVSHRLMTPPSDPVSASTTPSISILICRPVGRTSTLWKGSLGWKMIWLCSSSH
jgi:hypothetical protein